MSVKDIAISEVKQVKIVYNQGWEHESEKAVFYVNNNEIEGTITWENSKATIQFTLDMEKHLQSICFLLNLKVSGRYIEFDIGNEDWSKKPYYNEECWQNIDSLDAPDCKGFRNMNAWDAFGSFPILDVEVLHSEGAGSQMSEDEYDSYEGCGDTELSKIGFSSENIENVALEDREGKIINIDITDLEILVKKIESQFTSKQSKCELSVGLNLCPYSSYISSTKDVDNMIDNSVSFIRDVFDSKINEIELLKLNSDGKYETLSKNKSKKVDGIKLILIEDMENIKQTSEYDVGFGDILDSKQYMLFFYLNDELLENQYSPLHNYIPRILSKFDEKCNWVRIFHFPTGLSIDIMEDEMDGPLWSEFNEYLF